MSEVVRSHIFFSEFELDLLDRRLYKNGNLVQLNAKAFDLLCFLASNPDRVILKGEILSNVWDGKFVEESNLVVQISNLRKALDETSSEPRHLTTVPGKGYQFSSGSQVASNVIATADFSQLTIEFEESVELDPPALGRRRIPGWLWPSAAVAIIAIAAVYAGFFQGTDNNVATGGPRLSKVTSSGKVSAAAMSPDGHFLVYARKEAGGESLWVRQVETGSEQQIEMVRADEYVGLAVSPDSQFVFASVFSAKHIDPLVVKIPLLGGPSDEIPNVTTAAAVAISNDGQRLAFATSFNQKRKTLLGVANIDGSGARFIVTADHDERYINNFRARPAAWAPDGKAIALAVTDRRSSNPFATIVLIDPDDGTEKALTNGRWTSVDHLSWLDNERLAFAASDDIGQRSQIWIVDRATGSFSRVTNDLGRYSWISASNERILAVKADAASSLRIAEFNEESESVVSREIYAGTDHVEELDWDSKERIVFSSNANGNNEIWALNSDGTGLTQITTGANVTFGLTVWNSDDRFIFGSKQGQLRGIWQTDRNGKDLRQISDGMDQLPDVSNNGRIVFQRGIGHSDGVIIASTDGAPPRMLIEKCLFPAISPDGSLVACYFMDWQDERQWRIALVASETGEMIRKFSLPLPIYERQLRFHPSGRYLTQIFTRGDELGLILMPLDGGKAKVFTGLGRGSSLMPEWSADGTRFVYPVINETQDVVMISNP